MEDYIHCSDPIINTFPHYLHWKEVSNFILLRDQSFFLLLYFTFFPTKSTLFHPFIFCKPAIKQVDSPKDVLADSKNITCSASIVSINSSSFHVHLLKDMCFTLDVAYYKYTLHYVFIRTILSLPPCQILRSSLGLFILVLPRQSMISVWRWSVWMLWCSGIQAWPCK